MFQTAANPEQVGRVLGLDPGVATTGFGVVERDGAKLRLVDTGTIRTQAGLDLAARLRLVFEAVVELIDRSRPDAISVERILFSANSRTAMAVGQASGVTLLAAAQAGLPVETYSPNEVKLAVAGYGGAPKVQVGRMVASLLGLANAPQPDDAADACALAICHMHASGLRARIRAAQPPAEGAIR